MCNFLHTIRFLHATRCNNCRFSTTLDSVQLLQRVACDKLHTWNHGISRRQIIEWWTPLTRTAPPDTSEPIDPAVAVELAMMLDDVWLIWINSTGTLSALLATCHSFHISHGLLPHSCSQSQHTHTHTRSTPDKNTQLMLRRRDMWAVGCRWSAKLHIFYTSVIIVSRIRDRRILRS